MSDPPPIPAAALIVVRDRAGLPPELLMAERARALAFAGGALVFPGGRVEPGYRAFGDDDGAARAAAARELLEETGLAVGLDVAAARVAHLRAALASGQPLGSALADAGALLAPDRLVPFARWCAPPGLARRFDTRFFLADAAHAVGEARVDGTENVRLVWTAAADALRGPTPLLFPTRRLLERLATFATLAEAVADARARPPATITPHEELRGGVPHLCIPDGLGYPVTAEPLGQAARE